jgi:hypothetical protein
VRQQMRALGVDPAEADRRIASLSDAEVQPEFAVGGERPGIGT